jgi:hypothetical protein
VSQIYIIICIRCKTHWNSGHDSQDSLLRCKDATV